MSATPTHLLTASDGADNSVFTTASISPTAGKLVLLAVGGNRGGALPPSAAPTVSGNGLTWTQVDTVVDSTQRRLTLFRAFANNPSAGAVTITFADVQTDGASWSFVEWIELDTTGTNGANAIVQSATNNVDAASMTVTLASFAHVRNPTFGAVFTDGTGNITVGSGFTELGEANSPRTIETEWKAANDTTVDWSWTGTLNAQGIAVELKALSPSSFMPFL